MVRKLLFIFFALLLALAALYTASGTAAAAYSKSTYVSLCKDRTVSGSGAQKACSSVVDTLDSETKRHCAANPSNDQNACRINNMDKAVKKVTENKPGGSNTLRERAQSYVASNYTLSSGGNAKQPGKLGEVGTAEEIGVPRLEEGGVARAITNTLIFITAILSVIFLVIGGIRYASSNGNPGQIESAKKTVTYAVVGLLIAILATVITGFVIGRSPQ